MVGRDGSSDGSSAKMEVGWFFSFLVESEDSNLHHFILIAIYIILF